MMVCKMIDFVIFAGEIMATMTGHLMGQMFTCCIEGSNEHVHTRPRIDRSMIGNPTNFRHTAHVGSSDFDNSNNSSTTTGSSDNMGLLQNQMKSKGGYDVMCNTTAPYVPHIINARSLDEVRRK